MAIAPQYIFMNCLLSDLEWVAIVQSCSRALVVYSRAASASPTLILVRVLVTQHLEHILKGQQSFRARLSLLFHAREMVPMQAGCVPNARLHALLVCRQSARFESLCHGVNDTEFAGSRIE